jgi:hypothetical protein
MAVVVLAAGLAGCANSDSIGSSLDDFLGPPAPERTFGRQDDVASAPLPPGGAPPSQPAPAQPSGPPQQVAASQPAPSAPRQAARPAAEGQPTPGGPQLLAGQRAQSQPTADGPTSLSPQVQARVQPPSQPRQVGPAPQAAAQPAPTGGQGSLSEAARAADTEDGRRVVPGPDAGVSSELERRIDSLFGSSSAAPVAEPTVAESSVVGNWVLNEEDGLRTCAMTFSPGDAGSRVTAAQDCSGLAATIVSWGLFGSDLLLNDAAKTVVARLRPSGDRWFGFTLGTGIPIVLARGG